MKFYEIENYVPINETEEAHVMELAESIKNNGFVGCPILVSEMFGMLVTGSHRVAAIKYLNDNDEYGEYEDLECAENVDDILEAYCEREEVTLDQIDFGNLSPIFEGTWVEAYKNEIIEW